MRHSEESGNRWMTKNPLSERLQDFPAGILCFAQNDREWKLLMREVLNPNLKENGKNNDADGNQIKLNIFYFFSVFHTCVKSFSIKQYQRFRSSKNNPPPRSKMGKNGPIITAGKTIRPATPATIPMGINTNTISKPARPRASSLMGNVSIKIPA